MFSLLEVGRALAALAANVAQFRVMPLRRPRPRPIAQAGRTGRRRLRNLATILTTPLLFITSTGKFSEGSAARAATVPEARGAEIVVRGGYPELQVNGEPFFAHSAAFSYPRIPRDLWEHLLDRYRSLGINTIDIYIPWNWHEPREGELDFDGHTNPRRDLRGLLRMVSQKGFKIIARPGPTILNEWRHGGYPGWLLERAEYKMSLVDRLEGRYPPLANLGAHDVEASSRGWLENTTHMAYAQKWLDAVARELAPYSSHRMVEVSSELTPASRPHPISGPLLFVQLEQGVTLGRTNDPGPDFWRYMEALRGMLDGGGLDTAFFIDSTDMRVTAAGFGLEKPIGAMGQWYLPPRIGSGRGVSELRDEDAAAIEFYSEKLETQPAFPPMLNEYQAGWYCPGDDARPPESRTDNTLLGSRLFLANGIHGFSYSPLQDTLTPAGYSVPWANRFYDWDAALDPDGDRRPRAQAVWRNGELLKEWGPQLASSHKRSDFGILYPLGTYPQRLLSSEDIVRVSEAILRIERLGQLDHLSSELADPEYQPVEQLLRHAVLLLPVFDPAEPRFQISENAQEKIVDYVQRGGTLVFFPERPDGKIISKLWEGASPEIGTPESAIAASWRFGEGHVLESSKNFFSKIALNRSFAENLSQPGTPWAMEVLREFLSKAGVQPAVRIHGNPAASAGLVVSQLISNEGTAPLGARTGGRGFLSVSNLRDEEASGIEIDALSPSASERGPSNDDRSLVLTIPARESLLLPLDQSACPEAQTSSPCDAVVTAAGAEYLGASRDGKTLQLNFYAPTRAEVHLNLEQPPSNLLLDEISTEATWNESRKELVVTIPRGASPGFPRTLKVGMQKKASAEKSKSSAIAPSDGLDFWVASAIRLPLGERSFLKSYPPLVALEAGRPAHALFGAQNNSKDKFREVNVHFLGPLTGSASLRLKPKTSSLASAPLKLSAGGAAEPEPDGLLHGTFEVRSGEDRHSSPISYLMLAREGENHYRFDFDRDGADEWVLENSELRLIISPESGGRAVALVEKATGFNLISSVGALRDNFSYTENSASDDPERTRGRYGLFNRTYLPEWLSEKTTTALRMHYDAPDIFPAGAGIEKTIRFDGADAIRVDYRIALHAPTEPPAAKADGKEPVESSTAQSFVAVNSLPTDSQEDRRARFCWRIPNAASGATTPAEAAAEKGSGQHCEDFVPGGPTIEVPEGSTRLEVRTPDRPGVALEWEKGVMTIERKNFSALLRLQFPPIAPGAEAEYTVRLRVLPAE